MIKYRFQLIHIFTYIHALIVKMTSRNKNNYYLYLFLTWWCYDEGDRCTCKDQRELYLTITLPYYYIPSLLNNLKIYMYYKYQQSSHGFIMCILFTHLSMYQYILNFCNSIVYNI